MTFGNTVVAQVQVSSGTAIAIIGLSPIRPSPAAPKPPFSTGEPGWFAPSAGTARAIWLPKRFGDGANS
jgi:hypothetical protein